MHALVVVERGEQLLLFRSEIANQMALARRLRRASGHRARAEIRQLMLRLPEEYLRPIFIPKPESPRKCSTLPRARSLSARKLSRAEVEQGRRTFYLPMWEDQRPKTRGECRGETRPCPWISCKWHTLIDVRDNGSLKINFPHVVPKSMGGLLDGDELLLELLEDTCTLDVADRVAAGEDLSVEQIASRVNLGEERARQLEAKVVQELRVKARRQGWSP